MTGPELVKAILAAKVDLLWNGGIGTYVKATHQSHADVGDRSSEGVRIDASRLRARVIGEGGNLGLTQAARVEAALAGVRLDSDAIHNSAGVDLSDHEVNFKILLARGAEDGAEEASERARRLFDVAEDACDAVLSHNRAQALAISLDEHRSQQDLERFRVAIEALCTSQEIAAIELGLPDDATLQARKSQDRGLTRPELAVLLGLAKLDLRLSLSPDAFVESDGVSHLHGNYYPKMLRERYGHALSNHQLRREITALEIGNEIIDVGGVSAITSLVARRGIAIPLAAAAWRTAFALLDAGRFRRELLELRGTVSLENVYDSLLELDDSVQEVARYLIAEGLHDLPEARTVIWREGLFGLRDRLDAFLSRRERIRYREREKRLLARKLTPELACTLAGAALADRGLNVI